MRNFNLSVAPRIRGNTIRFVALLVPSLLAWSLELHGETRVIVQFREEPLARRSDTRKAAAFAPSFERFRSDFSLIEPQPAGVIGLDEGVGHEFFRTFHGVSVAITRRESISALELLPYVRAVHPDLEVEAYSGDSRLMESPPRLPPVRANASGTGIVVAIIDSGIDYNHPALGAGIGPGRKVLGGHDFVNGDSDPMDDHRHGTHVAGIVAADSPQLRGMAPGASLLAYKVLNDQGKGRQSDVIAGIERAVDPDGDGDLSDRADIANLSLGSRGNPNDPVAQAVENAVLAGMVVVAATGNDGLFHAVGSPAVAESAIAVGAIDAEGLVAEFTNRGPSARSGAIKPDVLAPGVSIRSTAIGGGTLVLSGTSMAAPYVSGIAALLLEQHPNWSPGRIRSAIVNTADPLPAEEVMSQGSGLANLTRALASGTALSLSQFNFGLDDLTMDRWRTTRTISLTNEGSVAKTYAASATGGAAAVAISVVPEELLLAPGESGQFEVILDVDNTTLADAPSPSLAYGGFVTLDSGGETLGLPWAFLKAARAIVTFDREFPQIAWTGENLRQGSFAQLDSRSVETLLTPGEYDLILTSAWEGDVRLIVAERQDINGDVTINLEAAGARHQIRLDALDETGMPFPEVSTESAIYVSDSRLLFDTPFGQASLQLDRLGEKTLRSSGFSDRFALLFTESYIDGNSRRMYVAQHPLLEGVNGSRTLSMGSEAYQSRDVQLRFPLGSTARSVGILARGEVRRPFEIGTAPLGVLMPAAGEEWSGTLTMSAEVHPDYASGMQLFLYSGHPSVQGLASLVTPMLRRTDRGFISTRHFVAPPLPVEVGTNETFDHRSGPVYSKLVMSKVPQGWVGSFDTHGQRDEYRRLERVSTSYRIHQNGQLVANGAPGVANPLFVELPEEGRFRAEFVSDAYVLDGRPGKTTLDVEFDTRGDGTPPTLTSIAILDESGRKTSRLPLNGEGRLVFSVADFSVMPERVEYRQIDPGNPRVFFRRRSGLTWVQLPVVNTGEGAEDSASEGRPPVGFTYSVDLEDAARIEGEIVLRFEAADTDGNAFSYELEPAFVVDVPAARRRPARR